MIRGTRFNIYKKTVPYHMLRPKGIFSLLTLHVPVTKIAEFANSIDLDEVAHNESPHLDLHCLVASLLILNMI